MVVIPLYCVLPRHSLTHDVYDCCVRPLRTTVTYDHRCGRSDAFGILFWRQCRPCYCVRKLSVLNQIRSSERRQQRVNAVYRVSCAVCLVPRALCRVPCANGNIYVGNRHLC